MISSQNDDVFTVFRLETRNSAPFRVNLVNYIFFQYQIFLQAMIAYFTANYNILNFKSGIRKKTFPRGIFFPIHSETRSNPKTEMDARYKDKRAKEMEQRIYL